jgi:2-iminobutanoate/2-iminopropanoate deaminase
MTRYLLLSAIAFATIATGCAKPNASTEKRYIKLASTRAEAPFSDGVLHGDTLYLAGRLGVDPATGKIAEDPKQEVKIILDGLKATLAEASMTMDHLANVQVFCTDPEKYYDVFNEQYRTYFTGKLPARAFIGTSVLLRGARFEVLGIAAR